ncbi:hypothetical protein UT300005_00160 [Clostridium sp. CTA-5]
MQQDYLIKHIDRNENHVDRKYNIDRNIVSIKAYTIDEGTINPGKTFVYMMEPAEVARYEAYWKH